MPTVPLPDRAVISVVGPDAEQFLQNILTTDLGALAGGEVRPGALLTPQGKILFDFLISRSGADAFRLDCRRDVADDFVRRLMLYRLRAKVEISKRDEWLVAARWEDDPGGSQAEPTGATALADRRFPPEAGVERLYAGAGAGDVGRGAWDRLRIRHGIAESGADYALGDAFPHDVLLDQMGGVGFAKGCYVGQEVVSRMQHRGTARRRVLIAEAEGELPPTGTALTVDGRPIGALGSVSGRGGLAIARIDRVARAVAAGRAVVADGVALRLTIPGWARFGFPEDPASAEDD